MSLNWEERWGLFHGHGHRSVPPQFEAVLVVGFNEGRRRWPTVGAGDTTTLGSSDGRSLCAPPAAAGPPRGRWPKSEMWPTVCQGSDPPSWGHSPRCGAFDYGSPRTADEPIGQHHDLLGDRDLAGRVAYGEK
jgi:hypothetical protein